MTRLAVLAALLLAVALLRRERRPRRTPDIDVERLRLALFRAAPAISPHLADRIAAQYAVADDEPAGGRGGWER